MPPVKVSFLLVLASSYVFVRRVVNGIDEKGNFIFSSFSFQENKQKQVGHFHIPCIIFIIEKKKNELLFSLKWSCILSLFSEDQF